MLVVTLRLFVQLGDAFRKEFFGDRRLQTAKENKLGRGVVCRNVVVTVVGDTGRRGSGGHFGV